MQPSTAAPSSPIACDQTGLLELRSGRSRLLVSTFGAQVMSLDLGTGEILWTGGHAITPGEACWGGIPLCWPWFMTGWDRAPIGPFHGPARLTEWSVSEHDSDQPESAGLSLHLAGPVLDSRGGLHNLKAELRLTLDQSLRMELVTTNTGREPAVLEHCFHAYFRVGDIAQAAVTSPDGFLPWEEGLTKPSHERLPDLTFDGPYSRIFSPFPRDLRLVDPILGREIRLTSTQASHLVVWNSGPVRMVDDRPTGEVEWRTQLALEPLQGREKSLNLPPGTSTTLQFKINCRPLG